MFCLGLWWEPHLKTGFPCLFGLFWKIIPVSSIWKRDFPFFGLWWEPLENNANIFYLKTGIPFFWACDGNLWKTMPISSIWKRDFHGFPFFWACDGNLWKIMPISSIWKRDFPFFGFLWQPLENHISISSIWKRNFRVFLGLWREPHLKTGFPCLFGLFWKIMPISSIWKRDFPFFGFVMGTPGK